MTDAHHAGPDRQARWPQGMILAAQSIFPTMGTLLLVPVIPLLFRQFGTIANADYWIPVLLTVPALCIALLSPVAGWSGDRFGRRPILLGALMVYGFAGIAPVLLDSFQAILVSRVLLGICEAVIITLSATMIGDHFEGKARERWLAVISTIASLSAIVFLGAAGLLGNALGWRGPFWLYALSLLFVPAMLLLTWERKPASAPPVTGCRSGPAQFPWRHMAITAVTTLFGSTLFYGLVMQQGLALAALGLTDPARIGLLTSFASLGSPIGTVAFWRISTWPAARLLTLEFLLIGAAYVAIGWIGTDVEFAIAAFIGLFGCGLLLPTLITWTMRSLPHDVRGRGTGIFQSVFAFGQFATGLLLPFLTHQLTGNLLASFAAVGLVAIAIGLLIATIDCLSRDMRSVAAG